MIFNVTASIAMSIAPFLMGKGAGSCATAATPTPQSFMSWPSHESNSSHRHPHGDNPFSLSNVKPHNRQYTDHYRSEWMRPGSDRVTLFCVGCDELRSPEISSEGGAMVPSVACRRDLSTPSAPPTITPPADYTLLATLDQPSAERHDEQTRPRCFRLICTCLCRRVSLSADSVSTVILA